MEDRETLSEVNMTVDEIERLTKALKDEKFKEMLRDYAKEISDPENMKRYEEELKLLEQERGQSIEFIHPNPFRALKTSVDGKQRCFINICCNDKVGKPECTCGVSEDGQRGQCWSLPYSLHPGRQDRDVKSNKIMIYDVIFHPDTLHIASKNKKFMDMVDSTAIQGIENSFKVTLDKNNLKEIKTKYMGTPQPCVIRKPIPGYNANKPPEKPDPLAFPYPDQKRPTTSSEIKSTASPATITTNEVKAESFKIQPQKTMEPTKPNYTVKYRSVIDLQDFRCSRDSAQSPRPKEIVVTIDLPLLKSVTDACLEVEEKSLLLENKKPAYRLELPLTYPVDNDKGEAKFNKQRGQLTVTLPVLPSNEAFNFALGPPKTVSDVQSVIECNGERQEEKHGEEGEEILKEKEGEDNKSEQEQSHAGEEKENRERKVEEVFKQQTRDDNKEVRGQRKGKEQMSKAQDSVEGKENVVGEDENSRKQNRKGQESMEEEGGRDKQKNDSIYESGVEIEEKQKEQEQENEKEGGQFSPEERQEKQHDDKMLRKHNSRGGECDRAADQNDSGATCFQCDNNFDKHTSLSVEDVCHFQSVTFNNILVASPKTESDCLGEEGEVNLDCCLGSAPKIKTSYIQQENEKREEAVDATLKVKADAAVMNHTSSEESQPTATMFSKTTTSSHSVVKDGCITQGAEGFSKMPATDKANKSNTGGFGSRATLFPEELAVGSGKQEEREDLDEDDLPKEHDTKPPPAALREIDEDGNEKIITDYSTSAGIIFQNTMMYELD